MDGSMIFARWRQCVPAPNTCFLEPIRVQIPNVLDGFSCFAQLAADSRYALQRAAPFPLKIASSHEGSGLPSNRPTWWHVASKFLRRPLQNL